DVLAVVRLIRRQPEQALLQERIAAVPERRREAKDLIAIADPGDAVLAPAVRLAARQVVREVGPRLAVGTVILADRRPGPLGEVRPPAPPTIDVVADFPKPGVFAGGHEG